MRVKVKVIPRSNCKCLTFYWQVGGGPSTERHSCLILFFARVKMLQNFRKATLLAPELQEDLLGTKVIKVLLSLIQNKELGATRDVMAPELQEVSLYQLYELTCV